MAALLDFVSVRDQHRLAAILHHAPRISARWILDAQGQLVCTWLAAARSDDPAEDSRAADAAIEASRRKAA